MAWRAPQAPIQMQSIRPLLLLVAARAVAAAVVPVNVVLNGDAWDPDFHGFVLIDNDAWAADANDNQPFNCTTYNQYYDWMPAHQHFDYWKAFEGPKHAVAFWGKMACIMEDAWPWGDAMQCAYCGKYGADCFPNEFQFFVEQGKR